MKTQFALLSLFLIATSLSAADEPLEKLVSQLGKGDKNVSEAIVKHGAAAITPLGNLLKDKKADQIARMSAARLIGKIGGKEAVGPLRSALVGGDATARFSAIHALGEVGPVAAEATSDLAKELRKVASSKKYADGRYFLIQALEKIGGADKAAVEALVECMKEKRDNDAAHALAKFGEPGAEALIALAVKYDKDNRPENEKRYGEAYSIVAMGGPLQKEMMPVFKKHFEAEDPTARQIATQAMAGVGKDAIPTLDEYINSKNVQLRIGAAESLGTMNWFASRANGPNRKAVPPVPADTYYPKLKALYKELPPGDDADRVIRAMMGLDYDRALNDAEIVKVLRDQFEEAAKRYIEKKR